jgi:hypothetical protein
LAKNKTWLEWKILRQYLMLFNESMFQLAEVSNHIAINTKIIGSAAAGQTGDLNTLDLTIKFFNTYLRSGISKMAVAIVYNILAQYRQLGEALLEFAKDFSMLQEDKKAIQMGLALESRAIKVAKYMRYYSFVALNYGLTFLVEVISHDIRVLCEIASGIDSPIHDKILEIFLTVYDGSEQAGEVANRGVRRAQVNLATYYLLNNKIDYAKMLYNDMANESQGSVIKKYFLMIFYFRKVKRTFQRTTKCTNERVLGS